MSVALGYVLDYNFEFRKASMDKPMDEQDYLKSLEKFKTKRKEKERKEMERESKKIDS